MAVRVNRSDSNGVPKEIYDAIENDLKIPGDWGASVISEHSSTVWQLKLQSSEGRVETLDVECEQHDVRGVLKGFRELWKVMSCA